MGRYPQHNRETRQALVSPVRGNKIQEVSDKPLEPLTWQEQQTELAMAESVVS